MRPKRPRTKRNSHIKVKKLKINFYSVRDPWVETEWSIL